MWKFRIFRFFLPSSVFWGFRISAWNSVFSVCSVFLFGSPISVREGARADFFLVRLAFMAALLTSKRGRVGGFLLALQRCAGHSSPECKPRFWIPTVKVPSWQWGRNGCLSYLTQPPRSSREREIAQATSDVWCTGSFGKSSNLAICDWPYAAAFETDVPQSKTSTLHLDEIISLTPG